MNVNANKKLFSTSKIYFQSYSPSFKSLKNLRRLSQNRGNRNQNWHQNRTGQQQQISQTKETLRVIDPLRFHDNIQTELQKDVENFKRDNLRYFNKN